MLTVDDAVLDLFLFAGEPGEILNQYTALTGRAGQPVLWAMGAWLQQASGEMPTRRWPCWRARETRFRSTP